jgi:hypothetical protein
MANKLKKKREEVRNKRKPAKKGGNDARSIVSRDVRESKKLGDKLYKRPKMIEMGAENDPYLREAQKLAWARADPTDSRGYAGNRSEDMRGALGNMANLAANAGVRSGPMADVVSRMQSGLEGYNSREMQGMRESGQRELDRNLAGSLESAAGSASANRLLGGAAAAQERQIRESDTRARLQGEQDLMVKNATERQARLDSYGKFMGDLESSEFDRQRLAQDSFLRELGGQEQDEYSRSRESLSDVLGTSGQMTAEEATRAEQINKARGQDYTAEVGTAEGIAQRIAAERTAQQQNQLMGIRPQGAPRQSMADKRQQVRGR